MSIFSVIEELKSASLVWKRTFSITFFVLYKRNACFLLSFSRQKTCKIKNFSFIFWWQKNELSFCNWRFQILIFCRKTCFSITFCVLCNLDVWFLLNFLRWKTYKIKDFNFRFWCQKKWALFLYFKISNPYLL